MSKMKKKQEAYLKAWQQRQNGTALQLFRIDSDGEICRVSIIKDNDSENTECEVKKVYCMQQTQYRQLLPSTKSEFDAALKKAVAYFIF